MIKITIHVNDTFHNVIVPESKTIRQVLEQNGLVCEHAAVYINALPIQPQGLDTEFSSISDELTHFIIEIKPDQQVEDVAFRTLDTPKVFIAGSASSDSYLWRTTH